MTRRTVVALWVTLAVAGGATAVCVAVVAQHDRGRTAAQGRDIDPGAASRLAGTIPGTASPAPTATAPPTPARTPTRVPTPAAVTGSGPISVTIPAIGLRARIEPIGVDRSNEVAIPQDVRTVGWYRYSPDLPSQQGSTVLVGHVDSAQQGEGAFFTLRELTAGDRVLVRSGAGRVLTYTVVSRERFPKTRVPLDALFSTSGAPRLTLITCGGSFDATIRSYRDNVVVTAVPA